MLVSCGLKKTVVLFSILTAAAQQPPLIRVPVRIVEVPAVATLKNGSSVRGLRAEDFRLLDNDRAQKVQLVESDQPLSLAIVVQTNRDVRAWLPEVRQSKSVIEASIVGANGQASLTTCSDEVTVVQEMTSNAAALDSAFRSLKASGGERRCLDGIASAIGQLETAAPERRRVILLISQSSDAGSKANLADLLNKTETDNITVYQLVMPTAGSDFIHESFALGKIHDAANGNGTGVEGTIELTKVIPEILRGAKTAAGQNALVILTSELGGIRLPFRKQKGLEAGMATIATELHTGYVLSFTPDHSDEGYHLLHVEALRRDVTVRARPGYYVH